MPPEPLSLNLAQGLVCLFEQCFAFCHATGKHRLDCDGHLGMDNRVGIIRDHDLVVRRHGKIMQITQPVLQYSEP